MSVAGPSLIRSLPVPLEWGVARFVYSCVPKSARATTQLWISLGPS
jgi:hypothetical protein